MRAAQDYQSEARELGGALPFLIFPACDAQTL
jgi:hypothetical protein